MRMQTHPAAAALFVTLCGSHAAAQTNIHATMEHGGLTRSYIVHLPPGFSAEVQAPLVIALHPTGTTGAQFQSTSGWDVVSDAHGVVVAYPDGGLPAGANGGRVWNTWELTGAAPDDSGFLAALIDRLQADFGIAACRVYMTGFSAGAMMTNTFAALHADRIAAIAPVSGGWITAYGGMESQLSPVRAVPTWIWRGSNETFTTGTGKNARPRDVQDQEQRAFWVAHNGATYQTTTIEQLTYAVPRVYITARFDGMAPVWFTEVQGTGHVYQPGAADLVWNRFFSQIVSAETGCTPCPADISGDGNIDGTDLGQLLAAWGSADSASDLDGNGSVGAADLGMLLAAWGAC